MGDNSKGSQDQAQRDAARAQVIDGLSAALYGSDQVDYTALAGKPETQVVTGVEFKQALSVAQGRG